MISKTKLTDLAELLEKNSFSSIFFQERSGNQFDK